MSEDRTLKELALNFKRRQAALAELDAARKELAGLLARGYDEEGLQVTEMSRVAGISRDTAHRVLRDRN